MPRIKSLNPQRVLIVVNDTGFFLSHRLNVALRARKAGFQVTVASPRSERTKELLDYGFSFSPYDVQRGTRKFGTDCLSVLQLMMIFFRERPNIVHLVTAKPIIFGGVIARLFRVPTVAAVTGLGYAYSYDSWSTRLFRVVMNIGYRAAIKHERCTTIFQNSDNFRYFKKHNLVGPNTKIITGSGTKLADFKPKNRPQNSPPIVLLPCRMLETKGVLVFLRAAQIVNQNVKMADFILAGALDLGNPASVSKSVLERASANGIAQWVGYKQDISSLMARASIVVLPSFYNEGLPKTLIDAAAAGRPVITTDIAGCRDAIIPEKTGLLVKPQDENDLALKIIDLLQDPQRRRAMGRAGRELAELKYCDANIAQQHLDTYNEIIDFRVTRNDN